MRTLERVTTKIVRIIPEIVEADRGFRLNDGSGWKYCWTDSHGRNQHSEDTYSTQSEAYAAAVVSGRFDRRNISLADVLRALPPGVYLKTLGDQARLIVDDPDREDGPIYWDCANDSLHKQESQVLEFLDRRLT